MNPELKTEPSKAEIETLREERWKGAVEGAHETLRKIGHKGALGAVAPGGGRYIKYALDRNGLLSTGQRPGRINRHWNKKRLALKSFTLELFRQEYEEMERVMQKQFEKQGKEWLGVPQEAIQLLGARVIKQAPRLFRKHQQALRKAHRERQITSRRINRKD